jgi:DNA-binding transcriptional MerR regulator
MDPVLTLILLLAIIASLLYFYFWIRSIALKVDRRGLDVRLEELESSVRETTRWLETASGQIREDLENRTSALKNMLEDAENTTGSSRPRADQTAAQPTQTSPVSTDLEPPTAPADLWPAAMDTTVAPAGDPDFSHQEDVPLALEIAEPAPALPNDSPLDDDEPSPAPGDRRAQILQLADQGLELAEIARQLNTSRAEVELIVSFRRPR